MDVPKLKLTLKLSSTSSSGKATPIAGGASVGASTGTGAGNMPDTPKTLTVKLPTTSQQPQPQPNIPKRPAKPQKQQKLNDGFRPRRHRLVAVQVSTVSGYAFTVPAWATERHLREADDTPSTFVCPHEGCHKIFDSKLKWRRHQTTHKPTV